MVAGLYICGMLPGGRLYLGAGAVAVFRQLRQLGLCGFSAGSGAVLRHWYPVRAADPDDPVLRHGSPAGTLERQVAAGGLRCGGRGIPVFCGGVHVRRCGRYAGPAVRCVGVAGQRRVYGTGVRGGAAGRDGNGQCLLRADTRADRGHRGLRRGSLRRLRHGGDLPAAEREQQPADAQLVHRSADLRLL